MRAPSARVLFAGWSVLVSLAVLVAGQAASKPLTDLVRLRLSQRGGFVEKPFNLAIAAEPAEGSTIRYSLDGSEPSASNGQIYTNVLIVSNTVVIRAAVFRETNRVSRIATETFLFPEGVIHQGTPPKYP